MDEVLRVEDLSVRYRVESKEIRAVEDVSLKISRGEILGVVGESGSGKSTLAHAIVRLLPENAYVPKGKIEILGIDVLEISEEELRKVRWKSFSMVFQRSMNGLSPVHRVGDQLIEAFRLHNPDSHSQDALKRLREVLKMVKLPERVIRAYPHELSGGMMQRAMIALALINNPEFVIFDEATTALDVVTQGQIIDVIKDLVEDLALTGMVITHDMGVVSEMCDRIAVMYAGKIVEVGNKEDILADPLHPYTKALISSIPDLLKEGEKLVGIPGTLPDLSQDIRGCPFAPRCPIADERCFEESPKLSKIGERYVACFKVEDVIT